MDELIFYFRVHLIFQGCVSGCLAALFVLIALKFKDLI